MDPRRLENEDEEKFWEAWIKDELTFCYRFGKIGSPGGTKLKKFKTAAEAQAELEEKLNQKLAEGFVELGAEAESEGDESDDDSDSASDDDSDSDSESDDDSDSEDEDDDEERKESEPPPPPPKPTLPPRVRVRAAAPMPRELDSVKEQLGLLSKSLGGRSWRVRHRARSASRALERLGGVDPQASPALASVFSSLMADVIAPRKRLPLDAALALLWVIDAAATHKVVVGWRAKMLSSPAAAAIGVLAATFEAVPDPEVALHTGVALVERHLLLGAWTKRFAKVLPFLNETLESNGSTVASFLGALRPEGDAIVKARVAAAAKVKVKAPSEKKEAKR